MAGDVLILLMPIHKYLPIQINIPSHLLKSCATHNSNFAHASHSLLAYTYTHILS